MKLHKPFHSAFRFNLRTLNVVTLVILVFAFSSYKEEDKDQALLTVMMQGLSEAHYNPQQVNNSMSEKVFDLYIKRLDPNKTFLLADDVNQLKKYRDQIDEEINDKSYEFFETSTSLINQRIKEAKDYSDEVLSQPFNFSTDEMVETDADKLKYADSRAELKDYWRKYLKYEVLDRIATDLEIQNKAKETKDTAIKQRSIAELEADARKHIKETQEEYFKRLMSLDREDRLGSYLNTIANTYDPHTEYFPPKEKEDFDIALTGQLEGIGAQLQEKDGYIKVSSIVAGSASWRQGELKAGDIILKVGQGADEPVSIVGMQIDKAVKLIRGKKGTEVRLTVKKPDGSIKVIPIVRDIVVFEDTYAQSVIIKGKKNIGYIRLPVFYADFNQNGGRNCSDDVKNELVKLKSEKVDGIILDLRYNGGGSLEEVVKMAGLFIKSGPIVQAKTRLGMPEVMKDRDPDVVYDGPLVVMVNSQSASASEIMAAAMQDYNRAIIVGSSSTTFGKGTVQRFFDLDDYLSPSYSSLKPLGSVKITTQKFYRINGESTQLRGVIPDVVLPDLYASINTGEKDEDYPMPWDKISPADYKPLSIPSEGDIISHSKKRIDANPDFTLVKDEAVILKKQKDDSKISLQFDKFMAERKKEKDDSKKYESIGKDLPALDVASLKEDIKSMGSDTAKVARMTAWQKGLKKDIYLSETLNIIGEMK